ncbi:MAG TPA: hypothetical protein PLB47_12170, partial [Solirubrobacterales bacterium]|nr:hypothetical protein [Solirubrobacterales bacterium]
MGAGPKSFQAKVREQPWPWLLGLLTLLSAALLMTLRADLRFFLDDWALVIYREGGPTDWLLPHNEHIIVLPNALYKLSLTVFGMTTIPIHVAGLALFLTSVWLLFFWLRPLVGEPASAIGCAVLLFLGASGEDLVWTFQIGYLGSVAAGLAALLLLRRGSTRADAWACASLVVCLLFSSLVIPFLAGVAVLILFPRDLSPDWSALKRRCWVFLVPAVLYAIWWLGWGHLAENAISLHNAAHLPAYVPAALAYAASTLTGIFLIHLPHDQSGWAIPGLILAGGVAFVAWRRRRLAPELLVAVTIALAFWALSGLNFVPGREFNASRYVFPGAIFLLMILGGAFAGCRPGRGILALVAAVAAIAVVTNVDALFHKFNDQIRPIGERNAASLTVIDLTRDTVDPDYSVGMTDDGQARVDAKGYIAAVDKYGSAGLSDEEIDRAPAEDRALIDQLLVGALPVRLLPAGKVAPDRSGCRKLAADPGATESLRAPSGLLY